MNLTRYHQHFYSTPHYAATDVTPAVFGVRLMPAASRPPHARGHYAGVRRRFANATAARAHNRFNAS